MIALQRLGVDGVDAVRPLLRQLPHRLGGLLRLPASYPSDDLWVRELTDALGGHGATLVVAGGAGAPAGLALCKLQDWETRVLGRKTAIVQQLAVGPAAAPPSEVLDLLLREALAWARECQVELLSCRTSTDALYALHALQRQGFLLVDTVLDYVYDARAVPPHTIECPPAPEGCVIRPAREDDQPALLQIAENAFGGHFGRFHADPRLPRRVATHVYREWIRSCCAGYADHLFVAEVAGRLAGYSVWKNPSAVEAGGGVRLGHYSIAGIHHDFAGRGLFGALTHAGMARLADAADWIEGPTHINNYPVQRGYTRLHWRIAGARHTFHRWLSA
jgi:hypothetical protein